jgi:5-methyltetrahydrofolate--homocysteine methyltransferase
MLERIVKEKWLTANGVVTLLPAASVGDDVEIYADESRRQVAMVYHCLRQQASKDADRHNLCLADFVAPRESGRRDYLGAFAVTAGLGCEDRVRAFEAAHDDYSAIMLKALADRLAEAFAERMHQIVRRELWGYAADEALSNDELIAEKYVGIRPAPGYPACPDHTEKGPLFELLDAPAIGMSLTETYAMWPPASVSGFYFSHPESRYFAVGKIDRDQAEDYARRKQSDLAKTERWLAPALAYET